MIFSYNRLKKLINIDITVEQMVSAINSIGFEVEEYKPFNEVAGIKFGHVLKTYKNPNADRLTVCEIEFANDVHRIIQTTATNVKPNDYLMAFIPGAKSGKTVFAPRNMQGIVSDGMLVGLGEIGFNEDIIPEEFNDQIFTFGKIDLNLDPMEYLELNDYLIDITILSNRADANSYLIMAKEIAAYFNVKIADIEINNATLESKLSIKELNETKAFSLIETTDTEYHLDVINQMFLWKHNIKTFDNLIDLTNLTLLYTGVPTHIYNRKDMRSNEFSTKLVSQKINILGNKEVELNNNLVITNNNQVISLAATIGVEEYMYQPTNDNAIFEIASFNIKEIRKNAKQIKFDTNSSLRASKEVSLGSMLLAYDFINSQLIHCSKLINKPKVKQQKIFFDISYINKMAGFRISQTKRFKETLNKLECLGFKLDANNFIIIPTYRYDIETIQDITEEIFRFYGYDNFPAQKPSITRLHMQDPTYFNEWKYLTALRDKGYANIRTFTLIKPELNIFNPFNFTTTLNASMSKNYDHSQIRHSLIYSLNDIMIRNKKQGIHDNSFFELGMISDSVNVLGIVSNQKSFDEMKTDLMSLTNKKLTFKSSNIKELNPKASADIYLDDQFIGYIGKIHPNYLIDDAIYAEILIDQLTQNPLSYHSYNHMPLKSRDITVNVLNNQSIEETINKISTLKGIHKVYLQGIYRKDDGTKNITLSIILEEWATKKFDQEFNK
ncbi:Phenylalanine--tRNA ligase beta subunit [Metamycoplasma cloacale]|uniref:Phenylalanine--tRNA ligase beta subunit n=1 Tax=Metamycoplasma cloacale TaxID=92401 RepID=A0A2Z4LLS3_9BACT|nr:phenylalanine--tRNA ligase subunit beta [Metamycoplasma cloacale]AWX42731.1 phenylalanine--tRNA ligase subunit beta [Metamycoplasma cloacale]VEU79456.1 Phenylalanine--tRNA ligase beta subunit [Metamycoplasma cloacale]